MKQVLERLIKKDYFFFPIYDPNLDVWIDSDGIMSSKEYLQKWGPIHSRYEIKIDGTEYEDNE